MATTTKKKTAIKKAPSKKVSSKKTAVKKTEKKAAEVESSLQDLDRKGMSARAKQLKLELLAIRFNVTSPSLSEYRKKKKQLTKVLSALR